MKLEAMRAVGTTPAGMMLIEQIQALYEADRAALMTCDIERVKHYQGSASAYKKLIDGFQAATRNTI